MLYFMSGNMNDKFLYINTERKKGRYVNPEATTVKRGILSLILWKLGFFKDKTINDLVCDKCSFSVNNNKSSINKVAWINHATFLIEIDGINILTDPTWSDTCSPVYFIGPKRTHPPGIGLDKLPKIDYVLVSHNHYDHLDKKTVKKLNKLFPSIKWIVPSGIKKWFKKQNIINVDELKWWEEVSYNHKNGKIKIHSVPSQHFSGRRTIDLNRTLWSGFVVEFESCKQTKRVYFVGDSGYNDIYFNAIGEKFDKIDLSLIPIGTYSPRRFMKPIHVNPEEAVKIHNQVKSSLSIGMHWKTFRLSDEPIDHPPIALKEALKNSDNSNFIVVEPGEYVNW